MITLIVEDYCQECPMFEPDINREIAGSWDGSRIVLDTTVFCKSAYKCREMQKHFEKQESEP